MNVCPRCRKTNIEKVHYWGEAAEYQWTPMMEYRRTMWKCTDCYILFDEPDVVEDEADATSHVPTEGE